MNTTFKMLLGGLVLLSQTIGAGLARADDVKAGDLVISKVWSRATPGGAKVAAGYLTIENKGTTADRLIGGSTSIAGKLAAHEMITKNGVMTMHPVEGGLAIPPGKTVTLGSGGNHLMLTDLKNPLKQGDTFTATLEFERAGKVDVTFNVQGIGAKGPGEAGGAMDHGMTDHGKMKM
jgi:copper(I)-binding protein